jgi:hypothetical protein
MSRAPIVAPVDVARVERSETRVAVAMARLPRVSLPSTPGYGSGFAAVCALAALLLIPTALAGPVLVYRDGAYCPRERPANAPRMTAAQAIERAKTLLPPDFCTPTWYVSGCEFDPEWAFDTWRVFVQQYRETDGVREIRGRDHTYVVLDAIGNCIANIPGT